MNDFEVELKQGFLEEAAQSLADTEHCFLALEGDPENLENINKIFRLAHNLKGSSKAVGFNGMGAFTHEFETFILKIKNGELKVSPSVVSLLLKCNDHVIKMVVALKLDFNATSDSSALLEAMSKISMGAEAESAPHFSENEIEPNEELLAELERQLKESIEQNQESTDSDVVSQASEALIQDSDVVSQASEALIQAPDPATSQAVATVKANQPEETLRISVSKLEGLLNYIGEMVILQSVMREQVLSTNSLLLKKTVHQLGKVSKNIQDISMSLRMVPIKPTFQKMQRIVRDTAQVVNKEVLLVLTGEETELDKTVLEKINDPLVHLMRNSVDHGIEAANTRIANGKPAKGTVFLSAIQQSGKLVIEVKDDGGGLDPEKLKKIAVAKGLIKPNSVLTDKEAYALIFAPGFSTKEQVTDISGRGVGMDVVRTNINELSGEIQIESKLGSGTTFKIILPLTLAIIDGMALTFAGERYIIPLNHVHETLRPASKMVQQATGLGELLMLRGENLPVYRLGDFFGKRSTLQTTEMIALVVRIGAMPFAILVDDIIGQYQVVVKQLGPELQAFRGVSGSTILGDGRPALILEPLDLLKRKITNLGPIVQAVASVAGGNAA